MDVVTRLQCARQFLASLLPAPDSGRPVPLVEDLIHTPDARHMLHALSIAVRSPEGVQVWPGGEREKPASLDGLAGEFAVGSMQVRHMGRIICTLHAASNQ